MFVSFFQGLSEFGATVVSSVSQEIVDTARAIVKRRSDVALNNVEHFESWFVRNYRHAIQDPTSLRTAMKTSSAYDGESCRLLVTRSDHWLTAWCSGLPR